MACVQGSSLRIMQPLAQATLVGALLVGGCQALDRRAGLDRNPSEVLPPRARNVPTTQEAPPDVPKPLTAEEQARILQQQGLTDQALAAFERAIEENPRATTAYISAGEIYYQKGDVNAAQGRFETAGEVDPSNFVAHYKNGLMLQLLNRPAEAVAAYLRSLVINPYDFNANLNIATAYLQLNDSRQAITYAEQAVKIDRKSAVARVNLGVVYAKVGRHKDAVAEYREAAQLAELSPPLLLNLALSLGKMDPPRFEEMLSTLDELLKLDPSPVAHERRGYALFKLKRYDESETAFKAALAMDERHYPAHNGLGVLHINAWLLSDREKEDAHQAALESWRKSLRIDGNQPRIREFVGMYQ